MGKNHPIVLQASLLQGDILSLPKGSKKRLKIENEYNMLMLWLKNGGFIEEYDAIKRLRLYAVPDENQYR